MTASPAEYLRGVRNAPFRDGVVSPVILSVGRGRLFSRGEWPVSGHDLKGKGCNIHTVVLWRFYQIGINLGLIVDWMSWPHGW